LPFLLLLPYGRLPLWLKTKNSQKEKKTEISFTCFDYMLKPQKRNMATGDFLKHIICGYFENRNSQKKEGLPYNRTLVTIPSCGYGKHVIQRLSQQTLKSPLVAFERERAAALESLFSLLSYSSSLFFLLLLFHSFL
jgi:hypothetical protein